MNLFKYLLAIVVAAYAAMAIAATRPDTDAANFGLNKASPNMMQKFRLGDLVVKQQVRGLKAIWDFSVLGGAVATVNLKGDDGQPVIIPKGAIVTDCIIDTITPGTTSASGTISFGTGQATNDLKSALGAASLTGLVACVPVGTAATSIKMTADRTMTATIATGALTAGKAYVWIYYVLSDAT